MLKTEKTSSKLANKKKKKRARKRGVEETGARF